MEILLSIHTAHDDEIYHHALDYVKDELKKNRIRLAFIYRWMCNSEYFRQDPDEPKGGRYSLIAKHAIEKCVNMKYGVEWLRLLGYVEPDGTNTLTQLMDYIPTEEEKKEEEKKEKMKKERKKKKK